MTTITTRSGKGSPLTNDEVDANFTGLNSDKVETSGDSMTGDLSFGDNNKAIFGAGSDLQIYHHSGGNSIIAETGTGDLFVQATNIQLEDASGNNMIVANSGGAVNLYHNAGEKLATTSTGIDVTGSITTDGLTVTKASGDIATLEGTGTTTDVEANLVFNPVYDVNARIVSARDGSGLFSRIAFETAVDNTGDTIQRLNIGSHGDISFYEDTGTTAKLQWLASDEDLKFADSSKAIFGAGSDLQIYHDGSNSYISDQGTGNLLLETAGDSVRLVKSPFENMLVANVDGAVQLYYDNSLKLATTSTGIDVTGTVTADGLTVDGTSDLNGTVTVGTTYTTDITGNNVDFKRDNGASYVRQRGGHPLVFQTFETSDKNRINIAANGDISFFESTGTTPKLFWDASTERLGIGTSSPSHLLDLRSSTSPVLNIQGGDGNSKNIYFRKNTGDTVEGRIKVYDNVMSFETAGSEAMRIDSSGDLIVGGTSSGANDAVSLSNTGYIQAIVNGDTVGYFNRRTSDGEILRFQKDGSTVGSIAYQAHGFQVNGETDHSGISFDAFAHVPLRNATRADNTVSLGTSSYRFKDLHLSGDVNAGGLDVTLSTNARGQFHDNISEVGSGNFAFQVTNSAGTSLKPMGFRAEDIRFATGSSERMRINSSGNVGIGTASIGTNDRLIVKTAVDNAVDQGLVIQRSANSDEGYINYNGGAFRIVATDGDPIRLGHVSSSDRVTIDDSGNLMVGKTDTSIATQGVFFGPNYSHIASTNDTPLALSRKSSDGTILDIRKDGTTVGSIGVGGGDVLTIGQGSTYIQFHNSLNSFYASDGSSGRDNAIDIGAPLVRFKDLYLSGGVYLGGTGSANKLDDYEEGTFTPTLVGGTSAGTTTYNGRSGDYTKIGNTVRVGFYISFTAATGTGEMRLGGLPFTQNADNTNNVKLGGVMTDGINWDVDGSLILMGTINTTYMRVGISRDDSAVDIQGVTNETATIWGSLTYITNS